MISNPERNIVLMVQKVRGENHLKKVQNPAGFLNHQQYFLMFFLLLFALGIHRTAQEDVAIKSEAEIFVVYSASGSGEEEKNGRPLKFNGWNAIREVWFR